ncbi:hypothetical protein RSOLAG22IIIB_11431 [Rhizoctonia solani]|uniref:DNA 3'-5' helicase n=1 Tax=Rhizoctonia solani TaxID=456999 RepID=A0A0K6G8M3_9AGAM|nr:hypothetical protein RSOLAG22IIIB_11431 [Rhizoctonia solani]
MAATATANEATRKEIKKQLCFGCDFYYINLGNHHPNLAYLVHWLKHAAASADEILEYFPQKDSIPGVTLIFVDSQQLGHSILQILRQHLNPEIQHQVEIYHSTRGEWDKAVIPYGFEKVNGYIVLICTEALTMGMDFCKVTQVFQFLACSDMETGIQRGGQGGRDPEVECDVVFMIQDSLFNDSKEGQKRVAKEEQQSPTKLASSRTAVSVKGKAKSSAKTYSDSICQFINAPGCLVEAIDKEFGNPPRGEEKCLCQYHKQLWGEPSLQEQMRAIKLELEKESKDNNTAGVVEAETGRENSEVPEEDINTGTSSLTELKMRTKVKAKPYKNALESWLDAKYDSDECRRWNVCKHWLLPDKVLEQLSKDPGITTTDHLNTLKPLWDYCCKWGAEVLDVLQEVTNRLDAERVAQEEEKRHAQEEKQCKAEELKRQAELKRQEKLKRQQMEDEQLQQSLPQPNTPIALLDLPPTLDLDVEPRPMKRTRLPNLPKDATQEQKDDQRKLMAANKRAKERESLSGNASTSTSVSAQVSVAGPSNLETPPALDRIAKEEITDNSEQLFALENRVELHITLPVSYPAAPATPHTPVPLPRFASEPQKPGTAQNQYPTPWSMSANSPSFSVGAYVDHSPSEAPRRRRPKPRPKPDDKDSPTVP